MAFITRLTNMGGVFSLLLKQAWPFISLGILTFTLDSPRYYYSKGLINEGDESLSRLLDAPIDDPTVQLHRNEPLAAIRIENSESERLSLKILFTIPDRTETKVIQRVWLS